MINLCVLYPQPVEREKFDLDYRSHSKLIKEKTGKPFVISKFLDDDQGLPPFYQMFTMSFESMEEFSSVVPQAVAEELNADAARISTGGEPVIVLGEVEQHD